MKTESSDTCPCGSGKKYQHCCFGKPDEQVRRGIAEAIADTIAEANTQQPFSSLEEVNAFTNQITNERNQAAQADFCGLSPEQMTHLLYAPFTSPQTILFSSDIEPSPDISIMRLFSALVAAIGESGLKATAKGNLPLKFCKALAKQLQAEHDGSRRLRIGGIRSEEDLEELHCTRLVAGYAGLIRKYRGKFVLTRKCRDLLVGKNRGLLYFELFKAYTSKFNWGYRDGYSEAGIVQHSFLYTLFLLASCGETERHQRFYEDKFLTAFPMVLDMFPESSYCSAEDEARRCYFLRSLERFAVFFGLAELTLESHELYQYKFVVRKSLLLDCFVRFRP